MRNILTFVTFLTVTGVLSAVMVYVALNASSMVYAAFNVVR